MGDTINLKRARKARERAAAQRTATEQRARHGRTAAEKDNEAKEAAKTDARLDGHQRDRAD